MSDRSERAAWLLFIVGGGYLTARIVAGVINLIGG
jgi:hypothetical protein